MGELHFDCRLRYDTGFELDAAFEAGAGVTALFGPSGSGKSSILGLIAGTLRPREGRVRLGGRTLVDTGAGVFLPPERRRVGVVFQDHLLFPHLTARQNLLFGHGRRLARPMEFRRVVEVLEVGELLDRRPEALSGGQRQRVALGRALLCGPELLLLDEPLAALDEGLKGRILDYLERALAEWRLPTVFVSHDRDDVRRLAERVVVVEAGKVTASGPTAEALARAAQESAPATARPANLLAVAGLHRAEGGWRGKVGEQTVELPPGDFPEGITILVQIPPGEIVLGRQGAGGPGLRGGLTGVVREVCVVGGRAFVAVDAGQIVWAELTLEAARDLDLRPGEVVACTFKPGGIAVVQ